MHKVFPLVGAVPKSWYNFLVMEWVVSGNNKKRLIASGDAFLVSFLGHLVGEKCYNLLG